MKKSTIIVLTAVAAAGAAFEVAPKISQAQTAQSTTTNFNQAMTQMVQAMREGNTTAASKDYNQAYASMSKIMSGNLKNSDWINQMAAVMNKNKTELSSMMSKTTVQSMMGTSTSAGKSSTSYRTMMRNTSISSASKESETSSVSSYSSMMRTSAVSTGNTTASNMMNGTTTTNMMGTSTK